MKRAVSIFVLGLGGLVAAVALTLGALALAGEDVGHVVQPVLIGEGHPTATVTASPSLDDHGGEHAGTPASASPDDHGGDSGHGGSGSSGSGSGDSSGPGSGDD